MKKILAALMLLMAGYASAQGVSVQIGGRIAPGVYGSIDIGNQRPDLIYGQPVLVENRGYSEPVYVYVPQDQAYRWRDYCGGYQLCDRPVYFVQQDWYDRSYYRGPHRGNVNDFRRNEEIRRTREENRRFEEHRRIEEHHDDHEGRPGGPNRNGEGGQGRDDHHGEHHGH